jgi:PAS domain S-box-containing protein
MLDAARSAAPQDGAAEFGVDGLSEGSRRHFLESISRSEERFRTLVETIPAAVFMYDERTLYVNAAAERITGYGRDELMGLADFWRLVHPESQPRLMEMYAAHERGETIPREYEVKIVTKTGEPRWVLFRFDWVATGPEAGAMLGTAIDITERKQAEDEVRTKSQELQASEARYRALYMDNPSMYFTVAVDGTVLSVNEFGARELGYSVRELEGRSVLDVFHPEDRKAVQKQLAACLARGGEITVWQLRKVRKDGVVIWVEERARATRDADGNAILLVVCEDISARKSTELAMMTLREEVESKAEELAHVGAGHGLTFRELAVLQLLVGGKSDREIGLILGISPLTANKHVGNIMRKMKVRSRTSASVVAVREGLAI